MSQIGHITTSDEVLGGTPTFGGTRVPIQSLFDYLAAGDTIDAFLEDFPSLKKEQIVAVLRLVAKNIPNLISRAD